jgi:hypothetical protein
MFSFSFLDEYTPGMEKALPQNGTEPLLPPQNSKELLLPQNDTDPYQLQPSSGCDRLPHQLIFARVCLQMLYSAVLWMWIYGNYTIKVKASKISDDVVGKGYGWWAKSSDLAFVMHNPAKDLTPTDRSMERRRDLKDLHSAWLYFKAFREMALFSLFLGPGVCEIIFDFPPGSSTMFILANVNLFVHFLHGRHNEFQKFALLGALFYLVVPPLFHAFFAMNECPSPCLCTDYGTGLWQPFRCFHQNAKCRLQYGIIFLASLFMQHFQLQLLDIFTLGHFFVASTINDRYRRHFSQVYIFEKFLALQLPSSVVERLSQESGDDVKNSTFNRPDSKNSLSFDKRTLNVKNLQSNEVAGSVKKMGVRGGGRSSKSRQKSSSQDGTSVSSQFKIEPQRVHHLPHSSNTKTESIFLHRSREKNSTLDCIQYGNRLQYSISSFLREGTESVAGINTAPDYYVRQTLDDGSNPHQIHRPADTSTSFDHKLRHIRTDIAIVDVRFSSVLVARLIGLHKVEDHMSNVLINDILSQFDVCTKKRKCVNIKAYSSCYVVSCGVPDTSGHARNDAEAICLLAYDLQKVVRDFKLRRRCAHSLHICIGISSGVLVGGIEGLNSFLYDVWGDTVQVAHSLSYLSERSQTFMTQSTGIMLDHDFRTQKYKVSAEQGHCLHTVMNNVFSLTKVPSQSKLAVPPVKDKSPPPPDRNLAMPPVKEKNPPLPDRTPVTDFSSSRRTSRTSQPIPPVSDGNSNSATDMSVSSIVFSALRDHAHVPSVFPCVVNAESCQCRWGSASPTSEDNGGDRHYHHHHHHHPGLSSPMNKRHGILGFFLNGGPRCHFNACFWYPNKMSFLEYRKQVIFHSDSSALPLVVTILTFIATAI